MPAGFGRLTIAPTLARDGWPDPHLRTGDVTLVFTTDETCSNVCTAVMGAAVATNSAPVLGELATLSLRSKPPATFDPMRAFLLLMQAARRQVGLAADQFLTSRGTIDRSVHGAHFPQLLCRSRLRLCRRGYSLVLQSSHSALHLFVEEVSPVIHHRLKVIGQGINRPRVADLNRSLSRLPEVTVTFATDRYV